MAFYLCVVRGERVGEYRKRLAWTFEALKGNAAAIAPRGGAMWKGGADTFINKGTNGRWVGVLTEAQVAAYEKAAEERLGPECAKWLANGGDV